MWDRITWELAKQAIIQNGAATHAAWLHKIPFTLYTAANYGSVKSRNFGIGTKSFK